MKRILRIAGLIVWLALPVFLICKPADYFDHGPTICLSKRLLDIECPGCGLTRAFQHFLHFQFHEAWSLNKLVVIIFPVSIMIYIHVFGRLAGKKYFSFLEKLY